MRLPLHLYDITVTVDRPNFFVANFNIFIVSNACNAHYIT